MYILWQVNGAGSSMCLQYNFFPFLWNRDLHLIVRNQWSIWLLSFYVTYSTSWTIHHESKNISVYPWKWSTWNSRITSWLLQYMFTQQHTMWTHVYIISNYQLHNPFTCIQYLHWKCIALHQIHNLVATALYMYCYTQSCKNKV